MSQNKNSVTTNMDTQKGTDKAAVKSYEERIAAINTAIDNAKAAGDYGKMEQLFKQQIKLNREQLNEVKEQKKQASKKPTYTRGHALLEALANMPESGLTANELAIKLDELTAKNGGKPHKGGADTMVSLHTGILQLAGLVDKSNGKIKWVGKELPSHFYDYLTSNEDK